LRKIISVDYNGSAIFYAPPFNGSTEFYKYNYLDEGIFTWNIHVNDTSYFGQHYFFWNTNDTTLYPPEYWDPVNIIETDAIWMRTQENATELWLKTDVLRSKISEPNIPRWEYHNITVIMDSSTAGAAEYVNGTYYIETTSGVFTRGFAGIGTREDPSVYPLIPTAEYSDILRIDNWSFNYQNAPRAAFTYEQPDTSSWWSSESVPTVQFTDASNNAGYSATGWYWEFGDGTISTEQNPRHTYSTAGSYNVNLRVDTPEGFDWVLNETISSGTPYVSPWDNSTRATQMMTDTIVMGMIVFVLGATVAVVVAHLK
jgi:PKD repeat protein